MRDTTGLGALYIPGRRCPPERHANPPGACRISAARPAPCYRIPPAGLSFTRRHRGFTGVRPPGLPLACCRRVEQRNFGFSLELRTPPLPATHVQVGTGHRTRTRSYPVVGDIADPLSKSTHSTHATSCRTCTQKVPSRCDDRSPRQASSSQLRRHFRVPAQDPDITANEKRRLVTTMITNSRACTATRPYQARSPTQRTLTELDGALLCRTLTEDDIRGDMPLRLVP